ncbi:DUF4878 domain-containing protein [Aequorivita capsosiphonis]|uniref:DUF4878 domain-containing protein n=1 Tax=Aequorivita capsosiphonis TaxID=487317 RepID=UPI00047DB1BC|nr:DUF4878 domain-containing protein [Aequorivita capsosiphonis]
MKRIFIFSVILLSISCSQDKNLSPAETAKIVLKGLYEKDNTTMKKHTTADGYSGLLMIQDMVPENNKEVTVEILDESVDGDTAWVKYNTSYDEKPGVFKLVKENGQWKVSSKGPRERGPF